MSETNTLQEKYLAWLATQVSTEQLSTMFDLYSEIEAFCCGHCIVRKPLFELETLEDVRKVLDTVESNKVFRFTYKNKRELAKMSSCMRFYYRFMKAHPELFPHLPAKKEKSAKKDKTKIDSKGNGSETVTDLVLEPHADEYAAELGKGLSASQPAAPLPKIDSAIFNEENKPHSGGETSLEQLLCGEEFLPLLAELTNQNITTVAALKEINLWPFMNRRNIYSIGSRQRVFEKVNALLFLETDKGENHAFVLHIGRNDFTGETPSEAFCQLCEYLCRIYPLQFRLLIGTRIRPGAAIPIERTQEQNYLKVAELPAYICPDLSGENVLNYSKWLLEKCGEEANEIRIDGPRQNFVADDSLANGAPLAFGILESQEVTAEEGIELRLSKDDDASAISQKLAKITSILAKRYQNSKAPSLNSVISGNKDIPVTYINTWTKQLLGKTASQYLVEKDILLPPVAPKSREEKIEEDKQKLEEVTEVLKSRYESKKAESLSEIRINNPDIPLTSLNTWTQFFFHQTASQYLGELGILVLSDQSNTSEKLDKAMSIIRQAFSEKKAPNLNEIADCGIGVTINTLTNWVKTEYGLSLRDYLIREGLLEYKPSNNKEKARTIEEKIKFVSELYRRDHLSGEPQDHVFPENDIADQKRSSDCQDLATVLPQRASESVHQPNDSISRADKLIEEIEAYVLQADMTGTTYDAVRDAMNLTMVATKQTVRECLHIVDIGGKLFHEDAFVDWEDGAERIEHIIDKLMQKNNGYISIGQLYEYARMEMHMFLNDNNIQGERAIYDIARHLFEKAGYHGKKLKFFGYAHISLPDEAITTNFDIIKKYADEQGGVFLVSALCTYLNSIGISTGNIRGQMRITSEPVFFFYEDDTVMYSETMQINENWKQTLKSALDTLLQEMDGNIVLRELPELWLEHLPVLPGRRPWTPLLLQSVLRCFSQEMGARTIPAMDGQALDTLHTMLVTNDSPIQTFGDVIISFLIENEIEQREFTAEELRSKLVVAGILHGNELIWNMPKALKGDQHFAWDASGDHVRVKV